MYFDGVGVVQPAVLLHLDAVNAASATAPQRRKQKLLVQFCQTWKCKTSGLMSRDGVDKGALVICATCTKQLGRSALPSLRKLCETQDKRRGDPLLTQASK